MREEGYYQIRNKSTKIWTVALYAEVCGIELWVGIGPPTCLSIDSYEIGPRIEFANKD